MNVFDRQGSGYFNPTGIVMKHLRGLLFSHDQDRSVFVGVFIMIQQPRSDDLGGHETRVRFRPVYKCQKVPPAGTLSEVRIK